MRPATLLLVWPLSDVPPGAARLARGPGALGGGAWERTRLVLGCLFERPDPGFHVLRALDALCRLAQRRLAGYATSVPYEVLAERQERDAGCAALLVQEPRVLAHHLRPTPGRFAVALLAAKPLPQLGEDPRVAFRAAADHDT